MTLDPHARARDGATVLWAARGSLLVSISSEELDQGGKGCFSSVIEGEAGERGAGTARPDPGHFGGDDERIPEVRGGDLDGYGKTDSQGASDLHARPSEAEIDEARGLRAVGLGSDDRGEADPSSRKRAEMPLRCHCRAVYHTEPAGR